MPSCITDIDRDIIDSDSDECDFADLEVDDVEVDEHVQKTTEKISFYVTRQDIEKYGLHSEKECAGCKAIKRVYQRPLAHSDRCRQRIMERLLADGDPDKRVEVATKKTIERQDAELLTTCRYMNKNRLHTISEAKKARRLRETTED